MRPPPGNAGVPAGIKPIADETIHTPKYTVPAGTDPNEWHSRGYLPYRDKPHLLQFITYRLADSLPQEKLRLLERELLALPEDIRESTKRRKIETWLDSGLGCCALRHPDVARYVQDSFLYFHGARYHLHAWCIMPNHVHVLIEPLADLVSIVQGWKSFTSRWALARNSELALGMPGQTFWMREYWDRYIRDGIHYQKTVDYIHQNPVSAGLCAIPEAWPWSSANGRAPTLGAPASPPAST